MHLAGQTAETEVLSNIPATCRNPSLQPLPVQECCLDDAQAFELLQLMDPATYSFKELVKLLRAGHDGHEFDPSSQEQTSLGVRTLWAALNLFVEGLLGILCVRFGRRNQARYRLLAGTTHHVLGCVLRVHEGGWHPLSAV